MGKLFLFLIIACHLLHAAAGTTDFSRLDDAISASDSAVSVKEKRISQLRGLYENATKTDAKLELLDNLYNEYLAFKYDSAMFYVEKEIELARQSRNEEYLTLAIIRRALLNANGGYYIEAQKSLDSISTEGLSRKLLEEYHTASFWLYLYLGEYSNSHEMYPVYVEKMKSHISESVNNADPKSIQSIFMLAEKQKIADNDKEKALRNYMKVVEKAPVNSKIYAASAYSIAEYYKLTGDFDRYEQWLVNAAVADRITPLKENLALQELAIYLFENDKTDIERIMKYLNASIEDAIFFGNRLRIIEISEKLPKIQSVYLQEIQKKSQRIVVGSISLLFVALMLFVALIYIRKQKKRLSRQHNEMSRQNIELIRLNKRLNDLIGQLKSANMKISDINDRLNDINKKREWLAKISFSLCAKSIDKLKSYSTIVKRKVKAHQEADLLETSALSSLSEKDISSFIQDFDKAFTDLYPDFVTELNSILLPDQQLVAKRAHTLNTELRICALIRLGIKENSEIATLLFSSIQTIYNNRYRLKSRAINKDTFETDILSLCSPANSPEK